MTESFNWLGRCARAAAFGIAALLLLTIARIVFFFAYKNLKVVERPHETLLGVGLSN